MTRRCHYCGEIHEIRPLECLQAEVKRLTTPDIARNPALDMPEETQTRWWRALLRWGPKLATSINKRLKRR